VTTEEAERQAANVAGRIAHWCDELAGESRSKKPNIRRLLLFQSHTNALVANYVTRKLYDEYGMTEPYHDQLL